MLGNAVFVSTLEEEMAVSPEHRAHHGDVGGRLLPAQPGGQDLPETRVLLQAWRSSWGLGAVPT